MLVAQPAHHQVVRPMASNISSDHPFRQRQAALPPLL